MLVGFPDSEGLACGFAALVCADKVHGEGSALLDGREGAYALVPCRGNVHGGGCVFVSVGWLRLVHDLCPRVGELAGLGKLP